MSSTKKNKKSKGVTLSFQEFSARVEGDNVPAQGNVIYAPSKKPASSSLTTMSSWADEVEEDELITAKERIVLPSAPRASRGPAYEDSQIPKFPPFQANIGNLHYDIEEEDVYKFFRDQSILELKLPKDQQTYRNKGFGFVVFETRQDLIDALVMNEQVLRGRPVRVSLLSGDQRVGGDRRGGDGMRGGRPPPEDEGVDNWRSMAGETVKETGGGFGGMDRERGGGGGFDRGMMGGMDRDRGMRRDYGGDRYGDRRGGGGFDRGERGGFDRSGSGGEGERDQWRGGGERMGMGGASGGGGERERREDWARHGPGGSGGGGRRDDYGGGSGGMEEEEDFVRPAVVPRPAFVPRERPQGRDNREDSRGGERRGRSVEDQEEGEDAPPHQQSQPKERKKLVLQPRTKPLEDAGPAPAAARPSSIFGDAKPVDTLKKELEIEAKLMANRRGEEGLKKGEVGGEGGEKQKSGGEMRPPQRTHSQSSNDRYETQSKDSDPEDERDFKQQQRMKEQLMREQQRDGRRGGGRGGGGGERGVAPRGSLSRGGGGGPPTRGARGSAAPPLRTGPRREEGGRQPQKIIDNDGFETYVTSSTRIKPTILDDTPTTTNIEEESSPTHNAAATEKINQTNKFAALNLSDTED